ncbi:FtsX-like permease family protein [Puia dinghuensis]|uniref:ABC transporter permease n=1 Tax=Puia dinghuensis TaxID=1792502 RepID=A0A8J2XTA5_9BACT|nr:FtsX-like permease family protein [Puia dinghuensis]GGB01918.1 ABC transporter permease [Puia dinghuensis]
MLKNYFLVALRNLRHNKLFSLINILGLAIGISASLVIFLIVQYDFSFDRFEPDGDRIYRVVSDNVYQGNTGHTRGTHALLADVAKKELTGADLVVSFRYYNAGKLVVPGNEAASPSAGPGTNPANPATFHNPKHLIFADEAYFKLLPYQWLAGSPATALAEPGRVVLSESRALLYFPNQPLNSIVGRTLTYDDTLTAQVTGVVRDFDSLQRTDFNFKEFLSLATVLDNPALRKQFYWDKWSATSSDQQLYLRLGKGVKPAAIEAQLKAFCNKYEGESEKKNNFTETWRLQPMSDLHFNRDYGNFNVELADKPTLYGLMLIAAFLLLLASINFINLTTAQGTQRAREIGIRKTLGSTRRQLVLQFLSETFLITLAATMLSILLTPLLLKAFADFIPTGLHFSLTQPFLTVFLGLLVLLVSLLAGIYPALVLSSSKVLVVLKNQAYAGTAKTRGAWVRQGLTVSQFVIAQFFIMGALLVSKQIRYMLDKDLGFNKEAILSFQLPYRDTSMLRRVYMLDQVKRLPGVRMASLANDVPFGWGWWTQGMEYKDGKKDIQLAMEMKAGDPNYLRMFRIPLLAGRDLLPNDTARELVINEAAVHALGFRQPQEAIGKMINWDDRLMPIVGVMRDFHAHALSFEIKPMALCRMMNRANDLIVTLRTKGEGGGHGEDWQGTIAAMKTLFASTYPQDEFSYNFLDESIANSYNGQQRISRLLRWATGLTVFISCLGLLGLVIYVTNRRTKEIGIRKVLGASVTQITAILSKEFLLLVAIAFAIATPLSWWATHAWLQDYAYKTTLSWWVFALGGGALLLIALIVICLRTFRAATANPVKSLRSE